jgi:uncharacterized C2H2 Zn-finger protein
MRGEAMSDLERLGIVRCPYCGKFFTDKATLASHLNSMHRFERWTPRTVWAKI